MARMFWFHKEPMDLDVQPACSDCGCAGLLKKKKNTLLPGDTKIAHFGVNE